MIALPVHAQNNANTAANQAGQAVGGVTNQVPGALNAAGQTVGQVGNTAGNLVGGLQPTLQPVTQGVGGALNNLAQPDTISALLEFLAGVIPNHIEAHVNLDALRVEKLTVDVRGVDLRNLHVDVLVANSRNAGQVRPVVGQNGSNPNGTGMAGSGGTPYNRSYGAGANNSTPPLPGDNPNCRFVNSHSLI